MKTQKEMEQFITGAAIGNSQEKMKMVRKLLLSKRAMDAIEILLQSAFLDGVACLNGMIANNEGSNEN